MPWKDQLALGWRAVRRVLWAEGFPAWANAALLIVMTAAAISAVTGNLWGFAAALAVSVAIGIACSPEP